MVNEKGMSLRTIFLFLSAAMLIFGVYLAEIIFIKDAQLRIILTDLTYPLLSISCTFPLFMAASVAYRISKPHFLAWSVLWVAHLAYSLGDLSWTILELGFQQPPFPSVADGFYLAYYPLFFIGIFLLPAKRFTQEEWIKTALDMAIILIASILVFWNFLIGPVAVQNTEGSTLARVLSIAYPTGDLVLLWGLIMLIYNRIDLQKEVSTLLLGGSVLAMILTDSVFSIQSLSGTYQSGGYLDVGWIVAFLFAALAGISQARSFSSQKDAYKYMLPQQVSRVLNLLAAVLPYVWLSGAFFLLVQSHGAALPMDFSWIAAGVGLIISLVLIRQMIVLRENMQLTASLQLQAAHLEEAYLALQKEISIRQHTEDLRSHDALHDRLTGLPNRILFLDRLGQALELVHRHPIEQGSVLFLDLDQFKVINDSLGHIAGDHLLAEAGQRLKVSLRSGDTIARFGGDEFVILLQYPEGEAHTDEIAERIMGLLQKPFFINGQEVYTSASIGIVNDISAYAHPEEIIQDADIAMYRAKALGKARFEFFHRQMRTEVVARQLLEVELRQAIDKQEFVLHYQPIYSLADLRLTSFEVLIRWKHPKRGLLAPDEFLPVVEETGLIHPIGQWVLAQACTQLKQWHQQFPEHRNTTINVNVSSKQLAQPDFIELITDTLSKTGLKPHSLKLEITESIVLENQATVKDLFIDLTNLGVKLQIDDFGTGYSSLSYLQHFPIQAIKIDRSFIEEIGSHGKNYDLVRTMISMAHDLGMEAIAEGIETEEQLNVLKKLMCHFGQGYFLSRPVDQSSVTHILLDWRIKHRVEGIRQQAHD